MMTLQAAAKQFMISPNLFKKKPVSRFKFAHSVDPIKNLQKQISMFEDDENEIEVPKSIQDLIECKIRTLSNSLSAHSKSQTAAVKEAFEKADSIVKLCALNISKLSQQSEQHDPTLLKELHETWYTKGELKQMKQEIQSPQRTTSCDKITPLTQTSPVAVQPECNLTRVKVQEEVKRKVINTAKPAKK